MADKTETPTPAEPKRKLDFKKAFWNMISSPVEEPKAEPKEKAAQTKTPSSGRSASVVVETEELHSPSPSATKTGVVNEKMRTMLWDAIEQNDQEGMDFLEFHKMLESNNSIRPVDKYTAVFSALKALTKKSEQAGLKARLLETAKMYLDVLETEKVSFETDFNKEVELHVGAKRVEFDQATSDMQDLEKQKAAIEQQINEKRERIGQLEDDISKKDIELQRSRKNFIVTVDSVREDITIEMDNITQYIKEGSVSETSNQ